MQLTGTNRTFHPPRPVEAVLAAAERIEPAFTLPVVLLAAYLLALSSYTGQMLISYLHLPIPVMGLTFGGAVLGFIISGRPGSFLSTPFALPWTGLIMWWGLASVFGVYPGGSLTELWPYAYHIHILPLLFVAAAQTTRQVRVLMYAIACGYVLVIFYCFKFGTVVIDRFVIPNTSLGNSNDLAIHLLLGSAFMLIFLRRLRYMRFLWLVATPALAWYVLKTGSRSNMLTMVLLAITCVLLSPRAYRFKLLAGLVAVSLMIVPLIPKTAWNRLTTFTAADVREGGSEADLLSASQAADSTAARKELQRRGVLLTLRNPLLGVGPTMFSVGVDGMIREMTGHKSTWQNPHNTYLQVSSESGIPGLIFFLWTLVLCVRLNYRCYKQAIANPALSPLALQSFCLLAGTLVYAFGILFSHIAYDFQLSVLTGFSAANYIAFQRAVRNLSPVVPPQLATKAGRFGFVRAPAAS